MPSWVFWLIAVFVLGLAVILVGALRDRHLNRAREQEMLSPPSRAVPGPGGAAVPHYLSDLQASRPPEGAVGTALDPAARADLDRRLADALRVDSRLAATGFVTDRTGGRAVLERARVLVSAEPVADIRSLLAFLEPSLRGAGGCVVVAPQLDPTVIRTLEVNRIRGLLATVAVTADDGARAAICTATGATPVSRADLQAGWLPADSIGSCALWVSDRRHSWILSPGR